MVLLHLLLMYCFSLTLSAGGLQEEQIGSFKHSMVNEKKFVFFFILSAGLCF